MVYGSVLLVCFGERLGFRLANDPLLYFVKSIKIADTS